MRAAHRDEAAWDALARANAPWAVHSTPQFAAGWDPEAFYGSGRDEVAAILRYLETVLGVVPATGSALDFGCGLGRLTSALADRFDTVVGIDISAEMLGRAPELAPASSRITWTRAVGPDDLVSVGPVDFCLSLIALQHVSSSALVAAYVEALSDRLSPGGVAVVQIPEDVPARIRRHPLRTLARARPDLAAARPRLRPYAMRLTPLPEAAVREAAGRAGVDVVAAVPDDRAGSAAIRSLTYVLVRPPDRLA